MEAKEIREHWVKSTWFGKSLRQKLFLLITKKKSKTQTSSKEVI